MEKLFSIITRTYKRPKMFEVNRKSLKMQTLQDYEEILLPDEVGIGTGAANKKLQKVTPKGDYVWVYDDDNVLLEDTFLEKAKNLIEEFTPDVIFVKGWVVGQILPDKYPVQLGHVDTMNFIVSKKIWMKHRKSWIEDNAGDYSFISEVMKTDPLTVWLDMVACKTIRCSKGSPEDHTFELPADVLSRESILPKTYLPKGGIALGTRIRINETLGCADFSYCAGEIVIVDEKNVDVIESFLRGGVASELSLEAFQKS